MEKSRCSRCKKLISGYKCKSSWSEFFKNEKKLDNVWLCQDCFNKEWGVVWADTKKRQSEKEYRFEHEKINEDVIDDLSKKIGFKILKFLRIL